MVNSARGLAIAFGPGDRYRSAHGNEPTGMAPLPRRTTDLMDALDAIKGHTSSRCWIWQTWRSSSSYGRANLWHQESA